jgi:hypothetical protein
VPIARRSAIDPIVIVVSACDAVDNCAFCGRCGADPGGSGQDAPEDLGLDHAGELLVEAAVEVGELERVETHEVQEGGVQVADVVAVDGNCLGLLMNG